MVGAASQAGDADSSRAPGLTSGLQGSVNVHRGAPLLVPQWQCISSFVFYIVTSVWFFLDAKIFESEEKIKKQNKNDTFIFIFNIKNVKEVLP